MDRFLSHLDSRILIFDGAMGTQLQAADLGDDDFVLPDRSDLPDAVNRAAQRLDGKVLEGCNEILAFTRPEVIERIHLDYFAAGSDIVETNTFGSTSIVLAEYEIPELVYDVSLANARIARAAADRAAGPNDPKFVAGALGPGTKLISLGQTDWDTLLSTYRESFCGLIDGGADVLLLETLQDLLMVKAAVIAAADAMESRGRRLPLIVQITMEQMGTMLVGSDIGAALNMLERFPHVTAIGMNCATGPEEMAPFVRFLGENSTRPISIQPNAGLPLMEQGRAVYHLSPDQLADAHDRFTSDHGVALIGGCCGTTPAHIRAVADRLKGRSHTSGHWRTCLEAFPGFDFARIGKESESARRLTGCSSLYEFVPYEQDSSLLIVGERTNANGSKAFRELLASENWEALTELARELVAEGSHLIDVCTAYVGRNEVRDMQTLLRAYNQHITAPVMIDSTEVDVVEVALQCLAGKPVVNSINFEDGEGRTRRVLDLCRRYGAAVVGLTIDEQGMAKTADQKVAVAERILEFTREYGIPDSDVFIDTLTFTLGSGDEEFRDAGRHTIDAIRQIRERHPHVNAILGISNISFGLKPAARTVLNSAFLHHAREAGLNAAIVHASKIVPQNRVDPEIWTIVSDLVFDRRRFVADSV